jgi:hypothetical protein
MPAPNDPLIHKAARSPSSPQAPHSGQVHQHPAPKDLRVAGAVRVWCAAPTAARTSNRLVVTRRHLVGIGPTDTMAGPGLPHPRPERTRRRHGPIRSGCAILTGQT